MLPLLCNFTDDVMVAAAAAPGSSSNPHQSPDSNAVHAELLVRSGGCSAACAQREQAGVGSARQQ
jgi:hypothetical protein